MSSVYLLEVIRLAIIIELVKIMKNIKGKIVGGIGITILALSLGSLYLYKDEIKNNSEIFEKKIVVVKKDIEKGEEITNDNITLVKVKQKNLITGYLTEDDLDELNNKVAAIDLYANEQIKLDRLLDYDEYYPETSQYVSLGVDAISCLSGDVKAGDYVSLWERQTTDGVAEKKIENVQVVAIKDSQNNNIEDVEGAVPYSILVRVNNDEQVSIAKGIHSLFITKDSNQAKLNK